MTTRQWFVDRLLDGNFVVRAFGYNPSLEESEMSKAVLFTPHEEVATHVVKIHNTALNSIDPATMKRAAEALVQRVNNGIAILRRERETKRKEMNPDFAIEHIEFALDEFTQSIHARGIPTGTPPASASGATGSTGAAEVSSSDDASSRPSPSEHEETGGGE